MLNSYQAHYIPVVPPEEDYLSSPGGSLINLANVEMIGPLSVDGDSGRLCFAVTMGDGTLFIHRFEVDTPLEWALTVHKDLVEKILSYRGQLPVAFEDPKAVVLQQRDPNGEKRAIGRALGLLQAFLLTTPIRNSAPETVVEKYVVNAYAKDEITMAAYMDERESQFEELSGISPPADD